MLRAVKYRDVHTSSRIGPALNPSKLSLARAPRQRVESVESKCLKRWLNGHFCASNGFFPESPSQGLENPLFTSGFFSVTLGDLSVKSFPIRPPPACLFLSQSKHIAQNEIVNPPTSESCLPHERGQLRTTASFSFAPRPIPARWPKPSAPKSSTWIPPFQLLAFGPWTSFFPRSSPNAAFPSNSSASLLPRLFSLLRSGFTASWPTRSAGEPTKSAFAWPWAQRAPTFLRWPSRKGW